MGVFREWNTKKDQMGYSNKTHSEFAEILLQSCIKRSVATTQTGETALADEMLPTDTGYPTVNAGSFTVYLYYIRIVNCLHEGHATNILQSICYVAPEVSICSTPKQQHVTRPLQLPLTAIAGDEIETG